MLTPEQKEKYIRGGGSHCPYCNSDNIEGQAGFDFAGGEVWQTITCNTCHETWNDCYTLTGVDED